jgi:hypothetical protein
VNNGKIAIINVGANVSHGSLRSPIFADRTFEFIPIPEGYVDGLDRYSSFACRSGRAVREFVPDSYLEQAMHNDPEFETFTYGDVPESNSRAANLKKLNPGDSVLFLARLVEWDDERGWGNGGFFFVGDLVLRRVVNKSDLSEDPRLVKLVENNAHVKRWRLNPYLEPHNFWVFVGSDRSARYQHAVPFDGKMLTDVLRKADGSPVSRKEGMTDNLFIGCNTRACRIIESQSRIEMLRKHIAEHR